MSLVLTLFSYHQQAEAEKKTPKLLARILAPFKGDGKKEKKEKSPKSPKKKKGETEVYLSHYLICSSHRNMYFLQAAATSGEESSKEETEPPKEVKETEPVPVKEP